MQRKKIVAYKHTSEDWYPSITLHGKEQLVKVSLLPISGYGWRVCVWGADDFGMERDFSEDPNDEFLPRSIQAAHFAKRCYQTVISLEDVTRESLTTLGFSQA